MRHELEHVVRASWLVQSDVGHLYLSEGKSSQVKSTTWKTSAVKGPLPKMTVYHEYTGSKTCCVTAPHGVFEPMDRDPSTPVRTSHLSASTHPPIQYCSCGLDSTMEFHRGDALHAARTFYRTRRRCLNSTEVQDTHNREHPGTSDVHDTTQAAQRTARQHRKPAPTPQTATQEEW